MSTAQTWNIPLPTEETNFVYDGDGGRVKRITNNASLRALDIEDVKGEAISKTTIYIGSSYEITVDNSTGQVVKSKRNIFMGSNRICEVEDSPTDGIHCYFVHADHIGSSNIITDESGQRASLFEYEPFGSLSHCEEARSADEAIPATDKLFTGKTYDSSSGLYYYGARYYDPELGRFISADPTIQQPYDPQDFNRYAYCRNNPVKYVDPTGLGFWSWLKSFWKTIVAVAVIAVTVVISVVAPQIGIPILQMEWSMGILGATSAALRGGDIQSGFLFGVTAGAIAGLGLGAMGPALAGVKTAEASVFGAMAEGAVVGTATGATTAYAGGKGSIQETIFWAAIGNISTATLYGIGAYLENAREAWQHRAAIKQESKELSNYMKEYMKNRANLTTDESFEVALNKLQEAGVQITDPKTQGVIEILKFKQRVRDIQSQTRGALIHNKRFDLYGIDKNRLFEPGFSVDEFLQLQEGQEHLIDLKNSLLHGR